MKNNEQKFIDLKDLDKLVPHYWRDRINLLVNKDIPKRPKTSDDTLIIKFAALKESDMQQYFYKLFNLVAQEMKFRHKFNELEFVQNDNGDTAGGSLTQIQRMVLYKRKKAEGSRKGFPDCSMLLFNQGLNLRDTIFCEVKKIAAPSSIHIREEQLEWFLKLNGMGFNAYITNNPIFFRDVVLGEVRNFFN
tara:strand:+ start:4081 stop:4653 length:573 start_codon:yes stop_codon:yes gene_type:complete